MNRICYLSKEKSNIVFNAKEAAFKYFEERFGKEIEAIYERKITRLKIQLCTYEEKLKIYKNREDCKKASCLENLKMQREKEPKRLLDVSHRPALYVKRIRITKSIFDEPKQEVILHMAGLQHKGKIYELVEEKLYLTVFISEGESLKEIYNHVPVTEDYEGDVLYFIQSENLFKIIRELSDIQRICIQKFCNSKYMINQLRFEREDNIGDE